VSPDKFQEVVDGVIHNINTVMGDKSVDYSRNGDKLHNFKRSARVGETTPAKALLGYKLKHDVSILDMVDDYEKGIHYPKAKLMEKFGDAINYQILLLAIMLEVPEDEKALN
jgi:hypothetical protein